MDYKIIVWNCQGAGSNQFRRMVKSLVDMHRPRMLVLLEPRISGIKAERVIKYLRFERSHRVEAEGYSGGIWILWNGDWQVRIILNHKQYVHKEIIDSIKFNFAFTAVYGSPQSKFRGDLWRDLYAISCNMRIPWIVGGDFNAFLTKNEKCGGSNVSSMGCKKFGMWMRDCDM